jgi:copper resistance protein C
MKNFLASNRFIFLGLLLVLSFALAHSTLESSSPADGSVLAQAPKQVVLEFVEEAQLDFSTFKVYPLPLSPEAIAMLEAEPVTEESMASEETSSETTTEESTATAETGTTEDEHSEGEEHSGGGADELMDTAAEAFIPTVLELTGDEAERVDTGMVEKETSKTVTLNLKDGLEPGAYVVMWRVLSVDTHTVEGSLTFFVK